MESKTSSLVVWVARFGTPKLNAREFVINYRGHMEVTVQETTIVDCWQVFYSHLQWRVPIQSVSSDSTHTSHSPLKVTEGKLSDLAASHERVCGFGGRLSAFEGFSCGWTFFSHGTKPQSRFGSDGSYLISAEVASVKAGSDRTEATSAEMSLDMGYNRGW